MCICVCVWLNVCVCVCVCVYVCVCVEGIDLSIFPQEDFNGSELALALTLCSPQRHNIYVSLSNELFRKGVQDEVEVWQNDFPSKCQYTGGVDNIFT